MPSRKTETEVLRRILDVARKLAVTPDLGALLRMIVDATCDVLACERATIFLYDKEADELYSRVATGDRQIRFPAGRGVAGAAAKQRVIVNVPDAYADERFNREIDRKTGFVTRNLLTFPLENLSGDLIGVLQALNKHDRPFDAKDEDLARTLAAQAGVALDRGRLIEEYADKQRMARDLHIARSIQQQLFPKRPPNVPGYDVCGWNRSADETGGDCYDFVPLEDGRLAVILADASGHGVGAALVIAQCRSILRAMLSVTRDLSRIASGANTLLCEDLSDERFVTAFVGLLDPRAHVIDYVSAGQGPLLLVSSDGAESRSANGLPLAVLPDIEAGPPARFELPPGSTLALLTDGFFETLGADQQQYGEERLANFIRTRSRATLSDLIAALHADVCAFAAGQPQADDLTAVLIRRQG